MSKIHVMLNGLPGNVAQVTARHLAADARFALLPYSLTGPEINYRKLSCGQNNV